ncbi:MAG: hypothetical protein NT092_09835, partial [Bacteroidia bacterium]|nr:hypothetical protein [Bacteroidia bacterium]
MKRLLVSCSLLLVAKLPTLFGQAWEANPAVVERLSKSRSEINYYEDKVPKYILPDILANSDGVEITKPKEWTKVRRNEVLELQLEHKDEI